MQSNDTAYQVGERVLINKKELEGQRGTIQFIGALEGREGVYVGVELEQPLGTHDGKYKEKQYFSCPDKHGIFIMEKYLLKQEAHKSEAPPTPKTEKTAKPDVKKPDRADDKKKTKKPETQPAQPAQPAKPATQQQQQAKPKKEDPKKEELKKDEPKKTEIKKEEPKKPEEPKHKTDEPKKQQEKEEAKHQEEPPQQDISVIKSVSEPAPQMEQFSTSHSDTEALHKLRESEQTNRQQGKEIDSLNDKVELLQEEVENMKQASTALQAVNSDLKSQVASFKRKNEQLEQQVKQQTGGSNEDEIHELNSLIESLTMENDGLKVKVDTQRKTLDQQAVEVKRLREEKELAELELEEAILTAGSNLEVDEGGTNEANQGLVIANGKLRQALQVMSDKLELQQVEHELEIAQLQQQLAQMPTLIERVKLLDKAQAQLKKKDEEIEELSQRVDEGASLSEMVEKLAESMLKKDEELSRLKSSAKEMNELKKLNEEIIQDLEEMSKDQENTIKNLEFDLYDMKRRCEGLMQELDERDQTSNRLKTKIGQLNKQLELIKDDQPSKEDAAQDTPAPVALGKAQELLAKYQEVVSQRREMYKRFLNLQLENSDIRNEVLLKGVLLIRSIPQEYQSKLKFNMIDPLSQVRRVGEKASLLVDEFLQTIETHGDTLIKEENQDLGFWMSDAVKQLQHLCVLSLTFSAFVENSPQIEMVEKAARNGVLINQFKMAGSQVDELIRLVAEDKLSSKESISGLQVIIGHIQEDVTALTSEAFTQSVEYEGVVIRQRLQSLLHTLTNAIFNGKLMREQELSRNVGKETFKLDQLVETVVRRAKEHLKIMSSYRLSWGTFEEFRVSNKKIQKGKNGKYYDQLQSYLVEMLQLLEEHLKFETQEAFLTGKSSDEGLLSQPFYQSYRDRCISIAHVLNLLNQNLGTTGQSVQDLIDEFSISHRNTQSNLHVYGKTSAWNSLASAMQQQLQEITFTIESEKRLKEELDNNVKEKVAMQNDALILKQHKEALERRVVELQLKADRVQFLENEKRRHLEKIQGFNEATELTRKELENYETKYKELEEERNNLDQLITVYQQAMQTNRRSLNPEADTLINRTSNRLQTKLQRNFEQKDIPQSTQNLDVDVQAQTKLSKALLKEMQNLEERYLREALLEVTRDQPVVANTQVVSDASLAIRKLKSQQLRSMATAKVVKIGQRAPQPFDPKYEAIKIFTDAMQALKIDTVKPYYPEEIRKQTEPSGQLEVSKTLLLNTLQKVLM